MNNADEGSVLFKIILSYHFEMTKDGSQGIRLSYLGQKPNRCPISRKMIRAPPCFWNSRNNGDVSRRSFSAIEILICFKARSIFWRSRNRCAHICFSCTTYKGSRPHIRRVPSFHSRILWPICKGHTSARDERELSEVKKALSSYGYWKSNLSRIYLRPLFSFERTLL